MVTVKIFKKGTYYQTYEMKLEVWCDDEKQKWFYKTFLRKNDKEAWKKCQCMFEKIKRHVNEIVDAGLRNVKSYQIEELTN